MAPRKQRDARNARRTTKRATGGRTNTWPKMRIGKPPTGSTPSEYKFIRTTSQVVSVSTTSPSDDWLVEGNGIYKQFVYSLHQLPEFTDFTNLFAEYKITAVKQEFIFSNSDAISSSGYSNTQLIVYSDTNQNGATYPLPESNFLTSQTAKRRLAICNTPEAMVFWTPVTQLRDTYNGASDTDYAVSKPKFVSTSEPTTPHYGINCRIQRVDGQPMPHAAGALTQACKVFTTYYITCRKAE